jgi:hypothetical protein
MRKVAAKVKIVESSMVLAGKYREMAEMEKGKFWWQIFYAGVYL